MPSSSAIATRLTFGSRMKTSVPAGASTRLAVERERRVAADDDVQLLVPAGAAAGLRLVVLLDDLVADALARVGVDAERADAEPAPHRMPDEALGDRDRVELVDVGGFPAGAHRRRSSSSTTGSIRSTPSTRSSRFSVPAHSTNARSRSSS